MKYKIGEVCILHPGVHIKSSEYDEEGSHVYLNLRDFDDNYMLGDEHTRINYRGRSQFIVSNSDLLFSVRIKFSAYKIPEESNEEFVASTSFVIMRPDENIVLKDYLYWYLNNSEDLKRLNETDAKNVRMPYLSLKSLKELEVEIPERPIQEQVIAINQLHQREKNLMRRIIELKEIYLQNLLFNTVQL